MKVRHRFLLAAVTLIALVGASLFAQGQYNGQYPQNQPPQGQYSNDQGQYPDDQGGDPPGRVARLGFVGGNVSFQPSGEDDWSQALPNYPLTTGDRIYTDRDGRAELETGNIAVRLSAGTDVAATNLSDQLVQLGLAQGTLRVRAYDILEGSSVEIDTPNAALTLLRPGSYRVETFPEDYTTLVTVNSGDLEINGNGFSQVLHSGQSIKLSGDQDVQASWVQPPGQDDFDRWCGDRDRRFLSSTSRQYVGAYVPGYDDLDQYGSWQAAPDYGQVWYPTSVPAGWAPYRYGRWAWVEPWGWTWVEDEPWGFAPFHYGRWALIGSRWGWVPGSVVVGVRPVYAPALVAFVGGADANVQVWFPLGPRDPYIPWYHHSDGYLRQVNVTNVRTQVNIVNVINVRNVNNIHYEYQRVAPTAVSVETFRSSRPVARETVRVDVNRIGRAQVLAHPPVQPDVRAIRAGAPAAHPPVERTRPKIESRQPVANRNGNGNDRMRSPQRGGQPPSFEGRGPDNNRPQGTPANQNPADRNRPSQTGVMPQPGSNVPVTDVNRNPNQNHNNPPSDHIHAGQQPDNRDNNAPGNVRRENTLPMQVPRTDQQNGQNGQNRPENENAGRPQPGQNPNPPAAQQGGQNPRPGGQNPPPANADNGRDNSGRDNSGRDNNFNRGNQNADQNRGRGQFGGQPPNSGNQPNAGQPNANGQPNGGQPQNQRPLVTKNPPPQQNPSFSQRQPAMQEHPGRPLEPQQMDNIRRGQPAGEQHDRETPDHRNAAPPPQQQQQQRQQPPPQQKQQNQSRDGKDKDKDKDKPK